MGWWGGYSLFHPVRVALLFIDGVGVGPRAPATNPLARAALLLSQFSDGTGTALPFGGRRFDVDTTFGLPGRPQSATNQAALYTGEPVPQLIGRHVLGFPTRPIRELLERHSVIRKLAHAGRTATSLNGYPRAYLKALAMPHDEAGPPHLHLPERWKKKARPSASNLAMAAGGVALRTFDDVSADRALTHDVDGRAARRRGLSLPVRTALEAAQIFWAAAQDFTLFEHFAADEAAHQRDDEAVEAALHTFDAFARAVLAQRPADAQVLIVSDHGNVEDATVRTHTLNPVSVLSFGPGDVTRLDTVADVGSLVVKLLIPREPTS
jgi:hypothetical protein